MGTLIICVSYHHGNTARVAAALAEVLGARVVTPDEVAARDIEESQLIGFGSGIYAFRHHPSLLRIADELPVAGKRVFLFSTRGFGPVTLYHLALKRKLESAGASVRDEFSCHGHDTNGPLRWIGGLNKGRPDADDLALARRFAAGLLDEVRD